MYIWLASLILVLAFLTFSVADVFSSYQFKSTFLSTSERFDYKIKALDDKSSGKAFLTSKKIKQMDTDMLLFRYEGTEGEVKEKWEVKVKAADLEPVSYEKTIERPKYTASYSGNVHGKEMTLTSKATDREPRETLLSKSYRFYISMMMPHLLRNINFKTGDYYTFHLLLVEDGKFTTPIIQVKEKEVVEVPAGIYECWKLSVKLGSEQQYGWYSVKDPHYLVKYSYPTKELIMEKHS